MFTPVRVTIALYPIGRSVRAAITLYPIGRPTITLYSIGRPVRATVTLYPIGGTVRATFILYHAICIQVLDIMYSLPYDNKDGGVWKQGYDITYNVESFK